MRNNFFFIRDRRLERKKSDPPVPLLKQLFLKIVILQQKRRYQSDPIRSGIRSDAESDSESDPDFVNGQYQKAFESAMSASLKQIT